MSQTEKLGFLRSKAIGNLTNATVAAFLENEEVLLSGEFDDELLALTPFAVEAEACKKFAGESIFSTKRKLEIETASFEILGTLLQEFTKAMLDFEQHQGQMKSLSAKNMRLLKMMDIPLKYVGNRYQHLMQVSDFVSGLSDRSAVDLFKTIKGISL